MQHTLHFITGTTAVGKTEYALAYAEAHNAEIVSCDAALFYRGMDIGTAKPSATEQARVPHHLIDLRDVHQPYDIVAYVADAQRAVAAICARGKSVVITGGSGFYLKSFFAPVVDATEVPLAVRQAVAAIHAAAGLEGLLRELRRLNPLGIGNLDTKNPRRVMRALERCLASGKPLVELQAEFAARPLPYADYCRHLIILERDKAVLNERIKSRVAAMLQQGLVDEVRQLRQQGLEDNPNAAAAIGYRETLAYLRGQLTRSELAPAIIQNTRRLAKKQRTWLRTQIPTPDQRITL